jgi:uroporphyrin-III C-methyltransferase
MISEPIDNNQPNTPIDANKIKRRSWVGGVAFFAVLIALTCWFQLFHQQKKATNNYSQLQSSFHQTLSNTAQLSQTIDSLQTQITEQNNAIQTLQSAFNRLQAENSGHATEFALQQVDHYLLQAHLSLTFSHDIPAALQLLQAADQKLSPLSDPQLIPLRRAMNKDIIALKNITPLDSVGILSKLSALRDQTATLPLFALNTKTQQFHINPTEHSAAVAADTTWKKAWETTLATLKSLVIIRNRQNEISPLISVTQEEFLRQNLQLILQQAQWAVLQKQQSVYEYSLTQANEWLQRYFADNAEATQSMHTEIRALQQLNLAPQTPDLSLLIETLHGLSMQPNANKISVNTAETNTGEAIPTKTPPTVLPGGESPISHTAEKGTLV